MRPDPKVDPRRTQALFAELLARAAVWVPRWQPAGGERDFGQALLKVAARLGSEVTERLDRTPAKAALGLLDWLGVTAAAGRAARMPVVFRMADGAGEPVFAPRPVRIQADTGGTPTLFETEQDVRLVPSPIRQMVAVDPAADAIYYPPGQVLNLDPPPNGPAEWNVRILADATDAKCKHCKIQFSPALGLEAGTVLEIDRREYRIAAKPQGDIALLAPHIDPPGDVSKAKRASKLSRFEPFGGFAYNQQEHALYIGDDEALNLSATASIALSGATGLPDDLDWEYWGKIDGGDPDWQPLKKPERKEADLLLEFPNSEAAQGQTANPPKSSIEKLEVNGRSSRWIRARRSAGDSPAVSFSGLRLKIISGPPPKKDAKKDAESDCGRAMGLANAMDAASMPKLEGVANNTALVLNEKFYPLGRIPRQFDSFYLACPEVFSKKDARATIYFDVADSTVGRLAAAPVPGGSNSYRVFGVSKDGALQRYKLFSDPRRSAEYAATRQPRPDARLKSENVPGSGGAPDFQDLEPSVAPVVLANGYAQVFVASGRDVWAWTELLHEQPQDGVWRFLGTVEGGKPISGLALLGSGHWSPALAVLAEGVLHIRSSLYAAAVWSPIGSGSKGPWTKLAAFYDAASRRTLADGFVALNDKGNIHLVVFSQGEWKVLDALAAEGGTLFAWDPSVAPLAVYTAGDGKYLLVGKRQNARQLEALVLTLTNTRDGIAKIDFYKKELSDDFKGFDFRINKSGDIAVGNVQVLLALIPSQAPPRLAWWAPLVDQAELATGQPFGAGGTFAESPTLADSHIVVPGKGLDLLATEWLPDTQVALAGTSLGEGIVVAQALQQTDIIEFKDASSILSILLLPDNVSIHPVADGSSTTPLSFVEGEAPANMPADTTGQVFKRIGRLDLSQLDIKSDALVFKNKIPENIDVGQILLAQTRQDTQLVYSPYTITEIDAGDKTVKFVPKDPNIANSDLIYLYGPDTENGQVAISVRPAILLDELKKTDQTKPALAQIQTIRAVSFLDLNARPRRQEVAYDNIADTANANEAKTFAVLSTPWAKKPKPATLPSGEKKLEFTVQSSQGPWTQFDGNLTSNPDLSWEYWNGTGWWNLEGGSGENALSDSTENLKQSGCVGFVVPADLEPTDVVLGKKSHWIRARLVGGDYGRETFRVTRTPGQTAGEETQSVAVNTDSIRAPCVLRIAVAYSIPTPVAPKYLLTFDSGSWLDQSDANRTSGATADAFVPVAERLRQLSGLPQAVAGGTAAPCGCGQPGAPVAGGASQAANGIPPRQTGKVLDTSPPSVVSKHPADNASGVAVDSAVTVTFGKAMDPATIGPATFALRDAANVPVPAAVSYDPATYTATLKPAAALAEVETYTASLKGGAVAPAVKDADGIALATDANWAFTTAAVDSRAIYLVFDKKLQGRPISLLFLLDDQDHGAAAPLIVEALRDNRFERAVVAKDETRGLGESGVVAFSLDSPPTEAELFGIPGFWLRLRPRDPSLSAQWRPSIRGAYVNAVWAVATETQALEILGASDGSPSQQFALTRSPVLDDGLELRVREPLGDEEMASLAGDVVENPPGLPGLWVLWRRVPDPGDCGPEERVYALDFKSGAIRFGDGVHGAIPPVGRDAVVAFSYRHGGEEAANRVVPFAPLNLVTPIRNVEAAITPGQAAGGADPENAATVRRFAAARLRHRERAVTLEDLEDLALGFSPHIAQALAFASAQGARLVVVMRGPDPDPGQALRRELVRYLLERASPALARRDALAVTQPGAVKFRLRIALRLPTLEAAGRVGEEVKQAVQGFFDAGTGGYDQLGWRLGASPSLDDVAAQLVTIDGIDSIAEIRFSADGAAAETGRLAVKPDQLARLVADGVNIQFSTGTVTL